MNSAHRYLTHGPQLVTTLVVAGSLCTGAAHWRIWQRFPSLPATQGQGTSGEHRGTAADALLRAAPAAVFRVERPAAAQGDLAGRFRFAGVFFAFSADGFDQTRRAVLHDNTTGRQHIAREGESVEQALVVRIAPEHVVLREGSQEVTLPLSFSGGAGDGSARGAAAGKGESKPATGTPGETFGGRQVGRQNWVFQRDRLLAYYQELRDEPARLVAVFDSLKPVYDENHAITGYRLGIEGEQPFFSAVGMAEGDVVRTVNGVPMTNRRRAEFFIKQFVEDRVSAIVMDIERDGRAEKLVYQVR